MSDKITGSFYLKLPTFRKEDEWLEMGEMSFGNFYSYGGLTALQQFLSIAEKRPELMSKIEIKDGKNNNYTAEEFVLMLSDVKVIDNG